MVCRLPIAIGKDLICYNSLKISYDEDIGVMFNCLAQFSEIRIMELFIILQDSALSSGGFTPDPASVALSLAECSPTFAMASQSPV